MRRGLVYEVIAAKKAAYGVRRLCRVSPTTSSPWTQRSGGPTGQWPKPAHRARPRHRRHGDHHPQFAGRHDPPHQRGSQPISGAHRGTDRGRHRRLHRPVPDRAGRPTAVRDRARARRTGDRRPGPLGQNRTAAVPDRLPAPGRVSRTHTPEPRLGRSRRVHGPIRRAPAAGLVAGHPRQR